MSYCYYKNKTNKKNIHPRRRGRRRGRNINNLMMLLLMLTSILQTMSIWAMAKTTTIARTTKVEPQNNSSNNNNNNYRFSNVNNLNLNLNKKIASSRDATSSLSSSSSSSSSYHTSRQLQMIPSSLSSSQQTQQSQRELDEVELIGTSGCRLTTSLETKYHGYETGIGIMFSITAKEEAIEILTVEFDTFIEESGGNFDSGDDRNPGDAASETPPYRYPSKTLPVEVYWLEGDFSGAASDPSRWTQVANSRAVYSPDGLGAIIPIQDFDSIDVPAESTISLYLNFQDTRQFKFHSTSYGLIGNPSSEDSTLSVNYGVSFDDGPFPQSQFTQVADFSGRIHYRTLQQCQQVLGQTRVVLEWAINQDPTDDVIAKLNEAVESSIDALLILKPDLASYSKFFYLSVVEVNTGFMGRDPEKCEGYATCSLVDSTITFEHLQSIESGQLKTEILNSNQQIYDSVVPQLIDIKEIKYVGKPVVSEEYVFELEGVPPNTPMNAPQKRYFQKIMVEFLNDKVELSSPNNGIFLIEVGEEVMQGGDGSGSSSTSTSGSDGGDGGDEDGGEVASDAAEGGRQRRRRTRLGLLRGFKGNSNLSEENSSSSSSSSSMDYDNSRNLQPGGDDFTGTTQIAAAVFGAGRESKIREGVLEAVGRNVERCLTELSIQQLRPGEINKSDAGNFFAHLTGISVKIKPDNFGQPESTTNEGGEGTEGEGEVENDNSLYIYICIGGMVFGFLWLLVRLYFDCCHSDKIDQQKFEIDDGFDEGDIESSEDDDDDGDCSRPFFAAPPAFAAERRPSNQSIDRTASSNQSLDGNGGGNNNRSMHVPLTRNKSFNRELPIRSRSDNVRLTPTTTHLAPSPTPIDDDDGEDQNEELGYDEINQTSDDENDPWSDKKKTKPSKNRAGENGRGVKPTRSLPFLPGRSRFFGNKKDKEQENESSPPPPAEEDKKDNGTIKQDGSNESDKKATTEDGSAVAVPRKRGEPQRGVKATKSMPTLARPTPPVNKSKTSTSNIDESNGVVETKPKKGGKQKKTTKAGKKAAAGGKTAGTGNKKKKKAGNKAKKKKSSTDGDSTVGSLESYDADVASAAASTAIGKKKKKKKNAKPKPKNKAGKKRVITKSKSLPEYGSNPKSKGAPAANLEDDWASSDESEDEILTDLKQASKSKFNNTATDSDDDNDATSQMDSSMTSFISADVETVGSDYYSDDFDESSSDEDSIEPPMPMINSNKKLQPPQQPRSSRSSRSMKSSSKKNSSRKSLFDDAESSEESELDLAVANASMSSSSSESDDDYDDVKTDEGSHEIGKRIGPTGLVVGVTDQSCGDDVESSDESDFEGLNKKGSSRRSLQKQASAQPQQPTRYTSDDEETITTRESLQSNPSMTFKKIPKKPKRTTTGGDDETVSSRESIRSAASMPVLKRPPPPVKKAAPVKKHPPARSSSSENLATAGVFKKKCPPKRSYSCDNLPVKKHFPVNGKQAAKNGRYQKPPPLRSDNLGTSSNHSSASGNLPFKKHPTKKHAPISNYSSHSHGSQMSNPSVKKHPTAISNMSNHSASSSKVPVQKHFPKNRAGLNGRGISASKSLPPDLSDLRRVIPVHDESDSSDEESRYVRGNNKNKNKKKKKIEKKPKLLPAPKIEVQPRSGEKKIDFKSRLNGTSCQKDDISIATKSTESVRSSPGVIRRKNEIPVKKVKVPVKKIY